ncbi:hypothetical protein GCM10020367_31700 [Streptomyces sannanensis]|uniref:Alpha-amylase n=1 Tax=Streptomyces sannanensis TaxID=285536 RepID=A0ABP6SC23_9ACTN
MTQGPGNTFGVSGRGFPAAETVTLKNSAGAVINTSTTLPDGFFEFTGIPNDNYTVTSKFAKVSCAKAPAPTSTPSGTDMNAEGAITCAVTQGPGNTFGVSGRGFPAAETVTLKNSAGAVINTSTTLPDGFFEFTGIPNDNYTVTSKFAKVSCAKAPAPTSTPSGTDMNAEGAITCAVTQGPGNTFGVSGRGFPAAETVTLKNSAGAVINTSTTLPDGFFEFTGIPNDNYTVTSKFAKVSCAKAPAPTSTPSGTDMNAEGAITCAVTQGPGNTFGVSGRGFPAAETVTLKNSAGAVINTSTTLPDGFFEFTGIPNDNYTVTSKFAKVSCAKANVPTSRQFIRKYRPGA